MMQTQFNKDTKVFSGRRSEPIYNPKASLGRLLYKGFLRNPQNSSLVLKFHSHLRNQLKPGDVVNSIVPGLLPDDENLIHFYVAAILHGNPIHFIDHRSGAAEIDSAVRITSAKTVSVQEKIIKDDQDLELTSLLDNANPEPIAFFTTAGISGLPKLVPLSAQSIIHHLSNPLNTSVSALSFLPLSKYRIFLDALTKLVKGSSLQIHSEFSLDAFQEECLNSSFHELHLTNYQLAKIIENFKCPVKLVESIHISGCYANPILIRRARAIFPNAKIVYSYGLTEFGLVAINPDAGAKYTVGRLNDNYEVTIRDENGDLVELGQQGEIYIKSPVPFAGYFENPEATSNTLVDGNWCRTGDIGYFDAELDLHILDRDKEVIVYDCIVISPMELEVYLRKIPGVAAAKVYGVADPEKGELPAAKIVTDIGRTLTEEEINEFILSQLGPLKVLRGGVSFVTSL